MIKSLSKLAYALLLVTAVAGGSHIIVVEWQYGFWPDMWLLYVLIVICTVVLFTVTGRALAARAKGQHRGEPDGVLSVLMIPVFVLTFFWVDGLTHHLMTVLIGRTVEVQWWELAIPLPVATFVVTITIVLAVQFRSELPEVILAVVIAGYQSYLLLNSHPLDMWRFLIWAEATTLAFFGVAILLFLRWRRKRTAVQVQ